MPLKYGFYINMISRQLKQKIDDTLKLYDLTKSQADVLKFLHDHNEDIVQKDIENFFQISNPTVTGILNRLEQKGFIERQSNPNDKRTKYIVPTQKSLDLHKSIGKIIHQNEEIITNGFTKEEKIVFQQLLERALENISRKEEK